MSGFNMPPGVSPRDIPGNRDEPMIIKVSLHTKLESEIERFIRRMAASGWELISRVDTGLPFLTFMGG